MARWHGVHRALADPLRLRLLESLWTRPQSVKELARQEELPADRLYYHLGQLERAGLVEVAEYRRLTGGKVERVYAPASVEPPGDAATPAEVAEFLGAVLDATRADVTAAFLAKESGERREVDVRRGTVRLTDAALAELREHIEQLAERFDPATEPTGDADGVRTRVVVALVDLENRPSQDGAGRRRTS